jgi:UTP--glucose-1-phosphate uridylyltransferase
LGHAVTRANHLIGNEPFAISLADDLIDADPPVLKQMVDAYQYYRCSIIGVQRIPPEETDQYGIVRINGDFHDGVGRVLGIVEKPKPEDAPSNWAVVGRYVFTPGLFRCFDSVVPGAGGEIQLTDAIAALLRREQVLAYEFTGKRYDCGSKLGYLQANVEFGLKHPELSEPFREYLRSLIA